jgi:N-ethylmaleimide reductase
MSSLFSSVQIGRNLLRNRLVMAPMTRSRADDNSGVPSPLTVTYYGQRASAGMIITEGTFPSPMGKGYVRTPGINTVEQRAAWKAVVDQVHATGGLIFMQLMHCGRISHPLMLPEGALPVAPSPVKPAGQAFTPNGLMDFVEPRALDTKEIEAIIEEYGVAALHAIEVGFDGVELHAASGYLPEQFLASGTNHRTDRFGGSIAKRSTFILEVLDAMSVAVGSDRVGIKICPEMGFNDIKDADPVLTYTYLVEQLATRNLAYLHVSTSKATFDYHKALRPLFKGAYLLGGGLSKQAADLRISLGQADAAVFGSAFLANPDLPQRFTLDAALNEPNPASFYIPGPDGYIDYPVLEEQLTKRAPNSKNDDDILEVSSINR